MTPTWLYNIMVVMRHNIIPSESGGLVGSGELHPALADARPELVSRFLEFFAATIRNPNTRAAYMQAVRQFLDWCQVGELRLVDVQPIHVAAYVEALTGERSAATVKQHLAAIRGVFAYLVTGGALPFNPASDVRGPANVYRKGKSPVLFEDDVRALLAAIDTSHVVGLRDRAFIAVMLYSFGRVSAVCAMRVRDFEVIGRRASFVLHEKGGKFHRVPAHHKAAEYVEAYLAAAGELEPDSPLFRTTRGRSRELTDRPLRRDNALDMVRRRAVDAGFPASAICNHTCRATGITAYMQNGGTLETAANIAAHASTRTTQLYNRNPERVEQTEIERIRF